MLLARREPARRGVPRVSRGDLLTLRAHRHAAVVLSRNQGLKYSIEAATMMMAPLTVFWTAVVAPMAPSPLSMTARMRVPMRTPRIVSLPPQILRPPTVTAATLSIWRRVSVRADAAIMREVIEIAGRE